MRSRCGKMGVAVVLCSILLAVACRGGGDGGGGGDGDADGDGDECDLVADLGRPCDLSAPPGELPEGEVLVEVEHAGCSTGVCIAIGDGGPPAPFCTIPCDGAPDCDPPVCMFYAREQGEHPYECEAEVTVGDPDVVGTYCNPSAL